MTPSLVRRCPGFTRTPLAPQIEELREAKAQESALAAQVCAAQAAHAAAARGASDALSAARAVDLRTAQATLSAAEGAVEEAEFALQTARGSEDAMLGHAYDDVRGCAGRLGALFRVAEGADATWATALGVLLDGPMQVLICGTQSASVSFASAPPPQRRRYLVVILHICRSCCGAHRPGLLSRNCVYTIVNALR